MDSDSSFHSPSSSNEQQQEQEDDESEHETTVQNPNSIDTSLDAIENQLSSISFNTPVNETPVDYTHETGGEMMIHTDSVDENSYSRLWNNNIEVNDGSLTENNRETIINKDHVSEINDGSLTENNGETIINEGFIGESSNIEVNDGSLTENNGETVNNRSSVGESGYLRESEVNEGSLTESGRETVTNRGSVGESGYLWGNNINVEGGGEVESPSSSGYAGERGSSGTGSVTSGGCGADVIQEVNGVDSVDDSQAEGGGGKRHADEDDASISWRKRKKHFFILSHSGKPIYSRYGDEHKLAGFSATLQAIISFVENGGDRVKLVRAGKHQVVFLVKGPIYLVCISCTEEPYESLRGQLELLYGQMILILTRSVDRCFEKNSKFDMTPLLGGTEAVFSSLIHSFSLNPATFLHAYTCLPLAYATRQAAGAILQDVADTGVVFAILMCKDKVISLVGLQKASLHPDDMLLLANFVISSESFRTSESFSPICLPRYNPMAFLYAYVHYLDVDTYLILLTASSQAFFHLKECRIRIETVLSKSNVLNEVQRSMSEGGMRIDDLPVDPSARSRSLFHSNQRRPPESVVGIGGPAGLLHFIYRSIYLDQYVSSEFASPISTPQQQKRLYRAYQRLYASMHDKWVGPHKTQFRRDENYVLLCWVTQDFELYAAFDPLADKSVAIRICNRVCQWVKDVENEIFLLGASPFSW